MFVRRPGRSVRGGRLGTLRASFAHASQSQGHSRCSLRGVALITAIQGAISLGELSSIRKRVNEVASNWLPSVVTANEMNAAASRVRLRQFRMATTVDDPKALTAYRNLYDQAGAEMADARRRYEGLISSQQERALYDQFSSNWDRYEQVSSRLIRLIDAGRQQEAVTEALSAAPTAASASRWAAPRFRATTCISTSLAAV